MYNDTFLGQSTNFAPPEIDAIRNSGKVISTDPQIFEYNTEQGIVLYIRYNKGNLVCRNKSTNVILCSGMPLEYQNKIFIPKDQIEFYIEMYSQHKIKFK